MSHRGCRLTVNCRTLQQPPQQPQVPLQALRQLAPRANPPAQPLPLQQPLQVRRLTLLAMHTRCSSLNHVLYTARQGVHGRLLLALLIDCLCPFGCVLYTVSTSVEPLHRQGAPLMTPTFSCSQQARVLSTSRSPPRPPRYTRYQRWWLCPSLLHHHHQSTSLPHLHHQSTM